MPITNAAVQTLQGAAKKISEMPEHGDQNMVFNVLMYDLDGIDVRHPDDFPVSDRPLRDEVARAICNDDAWWDQMVEGNPNRAYYISLAERVLSVMYRQAEPQEG